MTVERNATVSDETILRAFLDAHQNGGTIASVAAATGMKLGSLNHRVQMLRKNLDLPQLKRRPTSGENRRKDVSALQTLYANLKAEIVVPDKTVS